MSLCNTSAFPPPSNSPRGMMIQRIYVLERENPTPRGSTRNACVCVIIFLGLVSLMSSLGMGCTERIKADLSTSTLCRLRRSCGIGIFWPHHFGQNLKPLSHHFFAKTLDLVTWARTWPEFYCLLWLWSSPLYPAVSSLASRLPSLSWKIACSAGCR